VHSSRRIGLRDIWNGWSRVFYTGLNKNPVAAGIAALAMVLFLLLPWLIPPLAIFELVRSGFSPAWMGLLGLGLSHCMIFVAIRKLLCVSYRLDSSLAWLQPMATAIAIAMLINSFLVNAQSRSVVWKGRTY
jgi:hypothetical protein